MLILEDGTIVGTIGGGMLENRVIEEGRKIFSTLKPSLISHKMQGADVDANEMICGGNADIFLEPIYPDNLSHLHIFKEIMEVIKRGGSGLLVTVLNPDRWSTANIPKMFIKSGNKKFGSLLGVDEIDEVIQKNMGSMIAERLPQVAAIKDSEGNRLDVSIEPVISDPVVYIFGGGHVSRQIGPIAHLVGFEVVVIDDRKEFSIPENFPYAKEVITGSFENIMERLPINDSSYLVIVTRGHSHDTTVLIQALETPAKYIGMIGSKRKTRIIFDKLIKDGFSKERIDAVYSPIGVDISAETPEEIAVAIVGELIKVRAGG
jgi:xanthine dehydrogenase accessory factor